MKRILPCVVAIAVLFPIAVCASALPAAQPSATADQAKLKRGERVRQMLLDALEQSYQNDGQWPDHLGQADSDLIYIRPKKSVISPDSGSVIRSKSEAVATVVLFERLERHPDGVWVGYADGHLEFAPDAAALSDCQSQLPIVAQHPAEPATQPAPTAGQVTLKMLDPHGHPVAGAKVGTYMTFGFKNLNIPPPDFDSEDPQHPFISNNLGEVTITATAAFAAKFTEQPTVPVYVLQKDRQLIAGIELRRSDFDRNQPLEVRLAPACIVRGSITSVGLAAGGKHLSWTNAIAFKPGMMRWYTVQCMSEAAGVQSSASPGRLWP